MANNKNTIWLVRSTGGHLLGPYAEYQIVDLLRERAVVPLDEVSEPCSRWTYLRETPQFAKIIEELRKRTLRSSGEETTVVDDENTLGRTVAGSDAITDELTQDILTGSGRNIQDVIFQSVDDEVRGHKTSKAELYTHEGDRIVKSHLEKSSKWLWSITTIVISLAVGFVVFKQFVARPIEDKTAIERSTAAGIEALEAGESEIALKEFKKAHILNPKNDGIFLYLGILYLQVENRAFEGRQLLEQIVSKTGEDLKRVYSGIGLANLRDKNFDKAEEFFNKAIQMDPNFQPAIINLAAVAVHRQDWQNAQTQLQKVIDGGSSDGSEVLMLVFTLVQQFKKSNDQQYLELARKSIASFTSKSLSYKLELSVADAYVLSLMSKKQEIYDAINDILEIDPTETRLFRRNLFIDRSLMGWEELANWCLSTTEDLEPNARVIAYEALCLNQARHLGDANKKIEDAILQAPKDPAVLAVYAQILLDAKQLEKASVAIDKALRQDEDQKHEQPRRLKAEHCALIKDFQCEQKFWQELYAMNSNSLAALYGLTKINLTNNNLAEAKKFLFKGLQKADTYMPFYPLNKTISQMEDANSEK